MRNTLKKIFFRLPLPLQRFSLRVYEMYWVIRAQFMIGWVSSFSSAASRASSPTSSQKINILFYHISGLSFGGTEKFLQIIAKHINKEKYNVYFMYSAQPRLSSTDGSPADPRRSYLERSGVEFISFAYEKIEQTYPYLVTGMNPSIFDILKEKSIDIVVTAGSGHSEFPFNLIKKIPVILLNIFGSPNMQPNIVKNVAISHAVADKMRPLVHDDRIEVMYIQSERPQNLQHEGVALRRRLAITPDDVVFGRIGRADDAIFDPIGINAFEQVVKTNREAHYIIMSPPPALVSIVKERKIPNVHFLPPSASEKDIWTFHHAIDILAHFRHDGESFGLNIAESMLAGNPIITHRSHIWNAQLEYLDPDFSIVTDKDDVQAYALAMKKMIGAKKVGGLEQMGKQAQKKGELLFIIDNNIQKFENLIDQAL